MKNEPIMNQWGDLATHDDCTQSGDGTVCSGAMVIWENMNTGNTRLLCSRHADRSTENQSRIHAEYLNDTVMELA